MIFQIKVLDHKINMPFQPLVELVIYYYYYYYYYYHHHHHHHIINGSTALCWALAAFISFLIL
jgi:hypothetical protein